MTWQTELRSVLADYVKNDETMAVIVAMYRSLRAGPRLIAGMTDKETLDDGGTAILENAYLMQTSAFMALYAGPMNAAYMIALNAYADSFEFQQAATRETPGSEAQRTLVLQELACRMTVHEIALTAVMCERGFSYFKPKSAELRRRLVNMKGVI